MSIVDGMRVECLACGTRYDVRQDQLRCPKCGANKFRLVRAKGGPMKTLITLIALLALSGCGADVSDHYLTPCDEAKKECK